MSLLMDVKNAGFVGLLLLMLGVVGFLLALVSVVLSILKQRAAFVLGLCSLALAALIFALGALGTMYGRHLTDEALGSGVVSKVLVEKITRIGYDEARSASKLGLLFGFAPFFAGAFAAVVGAMRRKDEPDPYIAPGQTATPEGGSVVVPVVLVGLGLMVASAPLLLMMQPLPGRAWASDDPTWDLLQVVDGVTNRPLTGDMPDSKADASEAASVLAKDCERLKSLLLEDGVRPGDVPDLALAQKRCADVVPKMKAPPETPTEKNLADSFGLDGMGEDVHPQPNEDDLALPDAGKTSVKAGIKPGQAEVSGRLAPEIIQRIVRRNINQIKFCYEKALRTNPALEGTIKVKFVIGRDGGVKSASAPGNTFPDASVTSCVTRVVFRMQFPEPEGGIVTVSYPFVFKPGA